MRSRTIRKALIKPVARPTPSAAATAAATPAAPSDAATKDAIAVTRLISGPTERSMPPSRMTANCPIAASASGATWLAILAKLRVVRKKGETCEAAKARATISAASSMAPA